jgi:hypothetical protein
LPGTAVKRVDTWRANKLDPTGGQATQSFDPDGTSWLEPGPHRTPTESLYATSTAEPHPETLSVWQIYGTFDVAYLHTTADKTALYDRYTCWPSCRPMRDLSSTAPEAIILPSPAVCSPARAQYGFSTAKGRA